MTIIHALLACLPPRLALWCCGCMPMLGSRASWSPGISTVPANGSAKCQMLCLPCLAASVLCRRKPAMQTMEWTASTQQSPDFKRCVCVYTYMYVYIRVYICIYSYSETHPAAILKSCARPAGDSIRPKAGRGAEGLWLNRAKNHKQKRRQHRKPCLLVFCRLCLFEAEGCHWQELASLKADEGTLLLITSTVDYQNHHFCRSLL